jgi:hypothetical protein
MRRTKGNSYNTVLIPVVSNSLRLGRFSPPTGEAQIGS